MTNSSISWTILGAVDGAQQDLQQMQRAAGLETVGVRGNAAHGVDRHRSADHALVALALEIGPRLFDNDFALEGSLGGTV